MRGENLYGVVVLEPESPAPLVVPALPDPLPEVLPVEVLPAPVVEEPAPESAGAAPEPVPTLGATMVTERDAPP